MTKSIFPEKGRTDNGVAPSFAQTKTGDTSGAIGLGLPDEGKYPMFDVFSNFVDKYGGWVYPFNEARKKEGKATPPPTPPVPGAGGHYSGRIPVPYLMNPVRARNNARREIGDMGYPIYHVPSDALPDGIATENYEWIKAADDLDPAEEAVVLPHEAVIKYVRNITGKNHSAYDGIVRSYEPYMAQMLDRGETGVIRRIGNLIVERELADESNMLNVASLTKHLFN